MQHYETDFKYIELGILIKRVKLSGGNVGIGTTNPAHKLDVTGNILVEGTQGFNAAAELAVINLGDTNHKVQAKYGTGLILSSTENVQIFAGGSFNVQVDDDGRFTMFAGLGASTGLLAVRKSNTATTNQVFIDLVTSSSGLDGPKQADIRLNGSGNAVFLDVSDERLKENIIDYTNGYNKVKALRIVEYNWIDEQKKEDIGTVVGVIAQEVQQVLPKAVGTFEQDDGEEYLGVAYSELIPFNWSATRTLIDKVETLESENDILKTQMTDLQQQMVDMGVTMAYLLSQH